ncbi:MAG: glutathione S-transferase family protein [Candidatus Binatia bacterium]|nr:glutathione S-transferase family protein [Candidatus Binatia bacterium]
MANEYVIYGPSISLFTRKLQAAFRFYGVPFRTEMPDQDIGGRAATHQVPVLLTPENWAIADTTPILGTLDARFPARRLFPAGPAGVLTHIVEEVLDEWFARTMVHYRWHYEVNTVHTVSELLGKEVTVEEARAFPLAQWGPRACRATGTESEHQQKAAETEYLAMLSALEEQLGSTRYALGDRPTAADAILLGGLRAHTNNDPIPDLSAFPRILAWDTEGAHRWDGTGSIAPPPEVTPFAEHILRIARDQYAPFVLGTRAALAEGRKAFTVDTYGEEVSYLARPYPEQSRQYVIERIRTQLDDSQRKDVLAWIDSCGLADCFRPED